MSSPIQHPPRRHAYSVDDYYRMAETGILRADFYAGAHPGPDDAPLIVEVADSSLRHDRDTKLPLYARHGIPEVWLVDIDNHSFTVHREPQTAGYAQAHALVSSVRIEVPGMAGMAVDLTGL